MNDSVKHLISILYNIINQKEIININEQIKLNPIKLKSSIYILQDTQLVLEFYNKKLITNEFENHLDKTAYSYLITYGLLQALILQQDSIKSIAKMFDVNIKKEFSNDSVLNNIRIIRNDSIGHPSNRLDGSKNFLSQTSVNVKGFDYLNVKNSVSKIVKIKFDEIISYQFIEINKIINKILMKIKTLYDIDED